MQSPALLLNTDWSPLNFVPPQRALCLLLSGRAEVVYAGEKPSLWDSSFSTPRTSYQLPATLRLLRRVNRRFTSPRFRKKVVFDRDDWRCQYCGVQMSSRDEVTIDHVIPKARGGDTSWRNCVTACRRCNSKKGARSPSEAGMPLIRQPSDPTVFHFWRVDSRKTWHPDWQFFISEDRYTA